MVNHVRLSLSYMYRLLILDRVYRIHVYRILALEIAIRAQIKGRSCPLEFIVGPSRNNLVFWPKLGRDYKILHFKR